MTDKEEQMDLRVDTGTRRNPRPRVQERYDVSIWGPSESTVWLESYTFLTPTQRNYWVDFAWRHGLEYRVTESNLRGGWR